MDAVGLLLGVGAATALGLLAGALTGLSPGLHVNNVAALVLATHGFWAGVLAALAPGVGPDAIPTLLATFLVATAVSHSIFDFVPSVFLGAPSEDTGLAVLPGHRLLLAGKGVLAVGLAARGAILGVLLACGLLIPLRFLLADPVGLYDAFRPWTAPFLLGILGSLLLSESRGRRRRSRIVRAAGVQALAGLLGLAVLRGPSGLAPEVALFPLFSGLFGVPGLAIVARAIPREIPVQDPCAGLPRRRDAAAVLRGTFAGAAISWLPGLSAGTAATLASIRARKGEDAASFMGLLGAAATSTALLSVGVLFVIRRARSGVAAAVREILPALGWPDPASLPSVLLVLLASAVLAAAAAAPLALFVARVLARRWSSVDPRRLARTVLALLAILALGLAGPAGLVLLALAGLLGTVPICAGVRRVHLMASLLVPVALG